MSSAGNILGMTFTLCMLVLIGQGISSYAQQVEELK